MTDGETCASGAPFSFSPETNSSKWSAILQQRWEQYDDIDSLSMFNGVSQRENARGRGGGGGDGKKGWGSA